MRRREFLACSAAAAIGSVCGVRSVAAPPGRQWRLAAEPGMFETDDVASTADQLRFAAEHGFRAFVDDGWLQRSSSEQSELMAVARHCGITWGPLRGPRLTDASRQEWLSALDKVFDAAELLSVRAVRVEAIEAPHRESYLTRALLEIAGRIAAQRSLTLLFDLSTAGRAAADIVREEPPELSLSIDVYLSAMHGNNVLDCVERFLPAIGHIELADYPGGLEPGTGQLDIARLCSLLDQQGYRGVVGLRHGRSQPGCAGIEAVLRACQRIEPSIIL
jgi:hydroxypyruvate isomerase